MIFFWRSVEDSNLRVLLRTWSVSNRLPYSLLGNAPGYLIIISGDLHKSALPENFTQVTTQFAVCQQKFFGDAC